MALDSISLKINGDSIECLEGKSILDAALENGIEIPNLCHHPDLKPFGACRLCLVEDEKSGKIMASCVTPAGENMKILTNSPRVTRHRRNIIRLMMAEHPDSCIVCSKGNRCMLRDMAAKLGLEHSGLYSMPNYKAYEQANPFISRDLSKCVLCGKCIRADHELVVTGAIDYNLRGFKSRPATVNDLGLEQSECTFCGTCVSICPTGALSVGDPILTGTPERDCISVCGFCGVGCSVKMGVAYDTVVETSPVKERDTVNGPTLCIRGTFAHDFLNCTERITKPMIHNEGKWDFVSWDKALERVTSGLSRIKNVYGPQSVGFLGSSKCTNEENYLFQKIARVAVGTNNVDNGSSSRGKAVLNAVFSRAGGKYRSIQLSSIRNAESIFILGCDPTHSAPVLSYYLKRAAKEGIPLVVVDPRETELVSFSSLWLPVLPNKDLEIINGLAFLLLSQKAENSYFIEHYTQGFSEYVKSLSTYSLDRVCMVTGVDMDTMRLAAGLLTDKKTTFLIGSGIINQRYCLRSVEALLDLCLVTGNLGRKGSGIMVVERDNNFTGACDMGSASDLLPGQARIHDPEARKKWESCWGVKISPDPGLDLRGMIKGAEKGFLKAMYIMGENPLRSLPEQERVRNALKKLEFLVVQDILHNETTAEADVLLPGSPAAEKGGSFTNLEGRIQIFEGAVPPKGDAKADWEILDILCEKMGHSRRYGSVKRIRSEIARLVPLYSSIGNESHVAWVDDTCRSKLYKPEGHGPLISFSTVVATEDEFEDEEYPFVALTGSFRCHQGSGTRTSHSGRVESFGFDGAAHISYADAESAGLREGDLIAIHSRHGSIERRVKPVEGIQRGMVFVPSGFDGNSAINLMGMDGMETSAAIGLNGCAVKIEKV